VIVLIAPIVVGMLRFNDRARAFYYVVMLTALLCVMNLGKLFYHQARPFWVSSAIQAYSCSVQYGNPSGHSIFAMGTSLTIWLDYNASMQQAKYANSVFSKWYMRLALLVLACSFGFSIGYSRIVLGAHSWNQTLFGWQLGLWLACTLHFVFRERLRSGLRDLFNGSQSDWSSLSCRWALVMFFVLLIETVNYLATEPRIENDPVWAVNISQKCPKAKMA